MSLEIDLTPLPFNILSEHERVRFMAKHSDNQPGATQISYVLHASRLRLSRFQLRVSHPEPSATTQSQVYTFDDGPVLIGTSESSVHLTLVDDMVSRIHCEITREGDYYVLKDLDSTNGTFVHGVQIKQIYLKPQVTFNLGKTRITFDHAQEEIAIVPTADRALGGLIGGDVKMREIFSIIKKIAPTDTTVIIEGETGTGKDIVAQTIHETSPRAGHPFVVVDCSAIPEHLIESELFGHEKGSFTGAIMTRQGLFEQADGGTIFLDELGELSLDLQPKLLRVLENRRVRRVGSAHDIPVNVRVIAATNRRLEDEVRAGRFREDLFYRLSVVRIFLPPLRDRPSDLPLLIHHFLKHGSFNRTHDQLLKVTHLHMEVFQLMRAHSWPGNVRELINVIERACTFAENGIVKREDLPRSLQHHSLSATPQDFTSSEIRVMNSQSLSIEELCVLIGDDPLLPISQRSRTESDSSSNASQTSRSVVLEPVTSSESESSGVDHDFENFKSAKEKWITLFERDYLLTALKRNNYNISHAAREAEIDRKYFRKLMQKYRLEVP